MNTVSVLILCVSLPVISPFLFDQPNKVFFKEREYEAAVVEYANTGTVITRVSAVSNSSQPIVYKLLDNTNDFVIDRNNGLIKTQRPLDRETMSSYRLTVIATFNSSDDELSKTLVHVQVLDVNDNAPVFERGSYTFLIKSDAPVGTQVGRVRATDADMGLNGQISYSLHFPGQDPFTVDRNDGTITLTRRPMHQQYVGTVVVTDSGLPSYSSSAQVQIDIQATSLISVEFTSNNYTFSVNEVVPMGTVIGKVSAVSNSSQPIVYKLLDNTNDFVIDRNNGLIRTQRPLDRETMSSYRLTVIATFNSSDDELSKTLVHVQVLDVNDNAPVFERGSYTFLIKSDAPVGTQVGRVRATDADMGLNGQISYSLHFPGQDPFTVDRNDGTITLTRHPMHQQYVGTVVVTDSGLPSLSSSAQIQIDIQAVPPSSVEFTSNNYTFSVNEVVPMGTVIGKVSAVSNSSQPIVYKLLDITNDFVIDRNNGLIKTQRPLDRETMSSYRLTVIATFNSSDDELSKTLVHVQVLDVNDNAPVFERKSYTFLIKSDAPVGTQVGRVRATDADMGLNGQISYSLHFPGQDPFTVDRNDGTITLTRRPMHQQYVGTVVVTDSGLPSLSSSAQIQIDLQATSPTSVEFTSNNYTFSVYEYVPMGTVIGKVSAVSNSSQPIVYKLLDITNDFVIDRNNGLIKTQRPLDRETMSSYRLTVIATFNSSDDELSKTLVHVQVLDVNDNAPVFERKSYTFLIKSDAPVGTQVGRVRATDADMGLNGQISFSLHFSGQDPFTVDRNDGTITLTRRPMHQQYVGTVVVTDSGLPSLSSSAQIQINLQATSPTSVEFTPNNYTFSVYEYVPMGTVIGKVSAVSNSSQPIVYKLLDNTNDFVIDRNNGLIKTQRPLDRENMSSYRLTVIATFNSSDDELSKTLVHVQVLDVNDNAPVFERKSYTFLIKSDAPVGTEVGRVRATDADMGLNGQISYSLHFPGQDPFTVDRNDGTITLTRHPMHQQYVGTVVVTDSGLPSLSSSAQVQIDIQAVSPSSVEFTSNNYTFSVYEVVPMGTVIGKVSAVSNSSQPIVYKLLDNTNDFVIDRNNGLIQTQRPLDRETMSSYRLTVIATFNSSDDELSKTLVHVQVLDVNDNAPVFERKSYTFLIKSDAPVGTEVSRVRATDADMGLNGQISYSLHIPGQDPFTVDRNDGTITLTRRPMHQQYVGTVVVTDSGLPSLSSSAQIQIDIQAVSPTVKFTSDNYTFSVDESEPHGTVVGRIAAVSNSGEPVMYSLTDGSGCFEINKVTGIIATQCILDREVKYVYNLMVSAFVVNSTNRNDVSRAYVTVNVNDINDNSPMFYSNRYVIARTTLIGGVVGRLRAVDADVGYNAEISYSLSDSSNGLFQIRHDELVLVGPLLRNKYNIVVMATDHGSPPRSTSMHIEIDIVGKSFRHTNLHQY